MLQDVTPETLTTKVRNSGTQVPSFQNRYPPLTPKTLRQENGPHVVTRCSKGGVPRLLHQRQNKKKKLISELLYCKSG